MKEKDNSALYIHMFIGDLGLIILAVGLLKYVEVADGTGPFFVILGFPFTMFYLNFLEEKAGISKKILRIKSIIFIIVLLPIMYIYFF